MLLKSKKLRIGLGIFAAALILVIGGFAFTRGYFVHFVVEGKDMSRDDFYRNAFAPPDQQIPLACAQGEWTLGPGYIYEVHCFNTEAEVESYMHLNNGSS